MIQYKVDNVGTVRSTVGIPGGRSCILAGRVAGGCGGRRASGSMGRSWPSCRPLSFLILIDGAEKRRQYNLIFMYYLTK